MKVHKLAGSIAVSLFGMLAAWAVQAQTTTGLVVTISTVNADGTPFTRQLTGAAAINLDADSPVGAPVSYGVFNIQRCAGCAGRARVFVQEGTVSKLVLTDAQITNTGAQGTQALNISISSPLSTSGPAGDYPFAAETSGTFTAPLGQAATDPDNRIAVRASARASFQCEGPCIIDNPPNDPIETSPDQYSVVAPPFLSAGLAQFAPKEQQIMTCDAAGDGTLCQPTLFLTTEIRLKARHGARLPGSIGAFHVPSRCEPDKGEVRGCEIMADFFASLGPKGFKVYDVRMEPSPGDVRTLVFRSKVENYTTTPIENSPTAWRTRRGEDDDDDDHGQSEGLGSSTRVRLDSNGAGEVKARGLCPTAGCPVSNALPVRVFCGPDTTFQTILNLDRNGNGRAKVVFSLPCVDPAVLIMDEDDNYWVAAPAIL